MEREPEKYFKHSICYEIWTVTHDRSTPYSNWKIFQIWISQNDTFLIYVTLNTFLLKITELADRTYKSRILKEYRDNEA